MSLNSFIDIIKSTPPILSWRKQRYERSFATSTNSFRGIFDTFEDAIASAPNTKAKGFDVAEFEGYFDNRRNTLFLYDYPILFWLNRIISDSARVFDVGGNTGVHYIGYRAYLQAWEKIFWEVCEVPVVASAGKKFAKQQGYENRLSFTTNMHDADGADVLLSLGTLQYIEEPGLGDLLASLESAPKHLLLGKLPLYDGEPYVTLQNGGVHFVAQKVFNREIFLTELRNLGYRIVDEWQDNSRSCNVPFHPEKSVSVFTGLYLTRL